jgi:hypothetical protein
MVCLSPPGTEPDWPRHRPPGSSDPQWQATYVTCAVRGDGSPDPAYWEVRVFRRSPLGVIERVVHLDNKAWQGDEPSQPEAILWPTWESVEPTGGPSASDGTALDGIHASWASSTDRIRDSAKWLATIIGVAVGALVGTSPLADLGPHPFTTAGWTCALLGLASLAVTMFLVLQVLRPSDVSYDETSRRGLRATR